MKRKPKSKHNNVKEAARNVQKYGKLYFPYYIAFIWRELYVRGRIFILIQNFEMNETYKREI